ncbi:MAG: transcriptional regulator [Chloroflexi bacterium]|nr:transcriptional regulator [Chloroflexota bacterium]
MARNSALAEQVQPTRRRILVELKKAGGLTCNELAERLGITSMGVRRHLITLERDGLVYYTTVQRGLGRPSHVYHLTELAEELFPKNYGQLTNELLSYIEQLEGEEKVWELFQRRARRRVQRALARTGGLSFPEKVFELARILEEEGYLAEAEQVDEDTFLLREYNCAIHQVAQRFPQACGTELEFFQAVLPEATIHREHHMISGEPYCGYRIVRREG